MTKGYQTTEFWMSLMGVLQYPLAMFSGVELQERDQLASAIVALISAVAYLGGRTWLKIKKG